MASKLFVLTSQAGELLRKKRIPSLLQKMDHKIAALSPLASEAYFELIVPEEKLGKRVLWFNDRPFRDSGGFHPRKLTRSAKWKGFFQDDNPNASLTWHQGNGGRGRLRKTSFQIGRPTYDSLTGRYSFVLTLLNGSRIPFRRKDEIAITSLCLLMMREVRFLQQKSLAMLCKLQLMDILLIRHILLSKLHCKQP